MPRPKPIDFSKPPEGIPKHKLFRTLLQRPRPKWPLEFRVKGVEHIPLHVVGMRSIEAADLHEGLSEIEIREIRGYESAARVIALCAHTRKGRAFTSAEEVMMLSSLEVNELGWEITRALQYCSPTFRRSDTKAWSLALREGAEHMSNFYESLTMYRSCDRVGMDGVISERPDRYFGIPMCELTDGQLMVFSAAVEAIKIGLRSSDG